MHRRPASAAGIALLALSFAGAPALAQPPREKGPFRAPDLVELIVLEPGLRLDIRYATTNNFVKRAVYPEARAFLQRPAAEALVRAHRALGEQGYGLLIFDGYRPWSVTKLFWDLSPKAQRAYVANPREGSKHNRGCAVDLSLFTRADGREVEMPSPYDDLSPRAHPDYPGGTAEQRAHRDLLRRAMEAEGFAVEPNEWWHFNYKDWKRYPILDMPFGRIPPLRPGVFNPECGPSPGQQRHPQPGPGRQRGPGRPRRPPGFRPRPPDLDVMGYFQ